MTTHERIEEQIATMLARRADEVPADLAAPSIADLGAQRLVRNEVAHLRPSNRKLIVVSVAAALAVITGVAIALQVTDDPPTAVIGIAPSTSATTTVVEPSLTSVATVPPVTLPTFDGVERAPSLAPGQECPATPLTLTPSQPIRVGQGQVAIVLYSGKNGDGTIPARQYADTGEIPVFWFAAREIGSILVRGYQLDGNDVMRFNDGPNNLAPSVWVLFSQGWSTFGMPEGWVHEPDIWLYVNNSGCYAIDILGALGYRDRLIIKVARS